MHHNVTFVMTQEQKPFLEHLEELRARLVQCLYALLVTSAIGYAVRVPVLEFLKAPLLGALPIDRRNLYFTGVFESFFNHLQVSILIGIFVGSPYFLFQIWSFIAPGLHKSERKLVWPFLFAGTIFFISGAAFAYYMVLPYGFKFFIEFGAPLDVPLITVKEYFSVLFRMLLLFGACFELPVILVLLARLGIIDAKMLRQHRKN